MNCQLTKSPVRSWPLHKQILYNVMYESGLVVSSPDKGAFAVQQPGRPLWLYAEEGWGAENLRAFFDVCLSVATGLVAAKWIADLCPRPSISWEIAAMYLPEPVKYIKSGSLVFPATTDIPILSRWIEGFYREALGLEFAGENAARALVEGRKLFCLESFEYEKAKLVSMGMLIPLSAGLSKMNLIYTPKEYRGLGHGKNAVAAIAAKAQECGHIPILYVRVENERAYNIYRALGFVEAGRLTELRFFT